MKSQWCSRSAQVNMKAGAEEESLLSAVRGGIKDRVLKAIRGPTKLQERHETG